MLSGIFVDVGANIGSCTFLLASKGHRVHSLEVNPKNQAMIEATLAANGALRGSVTLHKMGAGHITRDDVPIFEDVSNFGNTIADQGNMSGAALVTQLSSAQTASSHTKITRLDDLFNGTHIHLLKMDW